MKQLLIFLPALLLNMTFTTPSPTLKVSSTEFEPNGNIPSKYTCEGKNVNPPLAIGGIPANTACLAIIVEDPDAPNGTVDHWLIWNIPVKNEIKENSSPGIEGKNVKKENKYTGPCPPTGTHHYHFKVYALDTVLDLKPGSDKKSLEHAMQKHTLATGELIGLYKKGSANMGTK